MSLSLLLAFAFSVPSVSAAPTNTSVPRGDMERCTAYYLVLTEQQPVHGPPPGPDKTGKPRVLDKTAELMGFWTSTLAYQWLREGVSPADINARLQALLKTGLESQPDPATLAVCEQDIADLKAKRASASSPQPK